MSDSPYDTPKSDVRTTTSMPPYHYAGFWIRSLASLIDTLLLMALVYPLLMLIYGANYWRSEAYYLGVWHLLLNYVMPAVVVILFWVYRSATPGKILLKLVILDADSGEKPSKAQLVGRYFAYYVSLLGVFLGFLWVAVDKRKQAWHDKLAGTVVVRKS